LKTYTFEDADNELVSRFNGEPLNLPLTFWVMRNVQMALHRLGAPPVQQLLHTAHEGRRAA
jgi:hypothetical protein